MFVYDKLQNWTATVHHYIEGTTEKVAEDVIRSDLTVNSLLVYSATVSGYELAEGTSYVQTATRENSEITFYYKKIADSAYTVNPLLRQQCFADGNCYGHGQGRKPGDGGRHKQSRVHLRYIRGCAFRVCSKDGSTVVNVYYAPNDQTYSVYYYLEGTETPVPARRRKKTCPRSLTRR